MQPKLVLSKKEFQALKEQEFFVLKRSITEKLLRELNALKMAVKSSQEFSEIQFPEGTDSDSGKISKGENYLGLPYLVLDFPRLFSKEKMLAFRTMIWWGQFVSFTLLRSVSGGNEASGLVKKIKSLRSENVWFCINDSPWHHHFEDDNYVKLESLSENSIRALIIKTGFIKVSSKMPIHQIGKLREHGVESFRLFAKLL